MDDIERRAFKALVDQLDAQIADQKPDTSAWDAVYHELFPRGWPLGPYEPRATLALQAVRWLRCEVGMRVDANASLDEKEQG